MDIWEALALFREKIEPIKKDANNPFFNSKYADLSSILEVIKPLLKELEIVITHYVEYKNESYHVTTHVTMLGGGEFITSSFPLVGTKAQEFGSAITYARRYNIQAIFDLPTEDDDGNEANKAPKAQAYVPDDKAWIDDDNIDTLISKLKTGELTASSGDEAVKLARTIYKVSKKSAEEIKSQYSKYLL